MRRRRARVFRDELLAPWLTIGVILGLWWLGASALGRTAVPSADTHRDLASDVNRARADGSAVLPADRPMPAPADSLERSRAFADGDLDALLRRRLVIPVAGVEASTLQSTFDEVRGRGSRRHEAIDILAPRGTSVLAVEAGRIAKLFTSAAGGLTIYQFDPGEQFCYYYAHLDSYASDLTDGQQVTRGQTIGYVGTTGNAPPGTPHLHFAIFKLGPDRRWWEGDPIDPFLVLRF